MEDMAHWQEALEQIMDAIAATFGQGCEVVLHDLKGHSYEHSIVAIRNGHITGRRVGDPSTNKGLAFLRQLDSAHQSELGYFTKTATGKTMRSSSVYFHNSKGVLIGSLCINYDISTLLVADNALRSLIGLDASAPLLGAAPGEAGEREYFATDIHSLLQQLIQESMDSIGKPSSLMSKEEKCRGVRYLDERGVFLIKKSSEFVCKSYEISKNALYSFLEEIRQSPEYDV